MADEQIAGQFKPTARFKVKKDVVLFWGEGATVTAELVERMAPGKLAELVADGSLEMTHAG